MELPPYYPDDPVLRRDWAHYLDTVQYSDWEVGQLLDRLENEGILEGSYVFFATDHGISHARGKLLLYDEGIRIPFVVMGPGLEPGNVRKDLVLHLDMAATSLALAGIPIPPWMHGRDLFTPGFEPRRYVVSARDRSDESVDRIRSVRTDRFKYIRNHHPRRPYLQPNAYMDHKVIVMRLRQLHSEGRLDEAQSLVLATERPREELYDLEQDPWEIENLAGDPDHAAILEEMRRILDDWTVATGDRGATPEPAEVYEAEVEALLRLVRNPVKRAAVRANAELMKRWAAEGR